MGERPFETALDAAAPRLDEDWRTRVARRRAEPTGVNGKAGCSVAEDLGGGWVEQGAVRKQAAQLGLRRLWWSGLERPIGPA